MSPEPQPVKGELALRRITNAAVADKCGFSRHYTGRVLNGWVRPSARFRSSVAEMLGMPESQLFRDDILTAGRR